MIVVIADDLTGAAELGGIALRYDLVTEISTKVDPNSKADVLIIATDTRSLSKSEAELVTDQVSIEIEGLKPSLIFKKIDSVLRGHVLAEINIQKNRLKLQKALIVPANPGLGRTVEDGTYFLHGVPVHLSSFSQDPEFPIHSSRLPNMLYANEGEISVLLNHDEMPETGIIVGEVRNAGDLSAWCRRIDAGTLVAGAAEFFTALLNFLDIKASPNAGRPAEVQLPILMVCGSSFHKSRCFVKKLKQDGFPVSFVPGMFTKATTGDDQVFREWIDEASRLLSGTGKLLIAVDPFTDNGMDALSIRTNMAAAVACLSSRINISELLVEGGATAAAILQKLDIDIFYPVEELAPGVIRTRVHGKDNLYLTLKPGSYDWPRLILDPCQIESLGYDC